MNANEPDIVGAVAEEPEKPPRRELPPPQRVAHGYIFCKKFYADSFTDALLSTAREGGCRVARWAKDSRTFCTLRR